MIFMFGNSDVFDCQNIFSHFNNHLDLRYLRKKKQKKKHENSSKLTKSFNQLLVVFPVFV